jgi:hypothetical protein
MSVLLGLLAVVLFGAWSYQVISGELLWIGGAFPTARSARPPLYWGVLAGEFLGFSWMLLFFIRWLMTP